MRLLTGIFFFLSSASLWAQALNIDSVYARCRKLLAAGDTGAWKEIRWLENQAGGNPVAEFYYNLAKADAHIKEREREQAFGACMNALDIATRIKSDSLLFRVNYKIGDVYMDFNDLARALTYFNKAQLLLASVKSLNEHIYLLREMALLYTYLEKNELAVSYFKKVETLAQQVNNKRMLGSVYNNLALCYMDLGDSALGRSFLLKSLAIRTEVGDKHGIAQVHNNLGALYYTWKDYRRALKYYEMGLALRIEANVVKTGILESQVNIGKTYYKLGETDKAKRHLEAARTEAIQIAHIELERRTNEELMIIYSKLGDYRKAYELQGRYFFIRDSLYGLDKKEEISRITFENKIREDSLKHAEARMQEQAVFVEREKRSALVRNVFVVGFALVLGVAFLLYKQVKRIKQANATIEQQRDQIEAKQKEVLDSIYYARRIQQSLLASETYITRTINRLRAQQRKNG